MRELRHEGLIARTDRGDRTNDERPAFHALTPMRLVRQLHDVVLDSRFAARRLLKTPGWSVVSAGTLALGLAAAAIAWTLVRDVLLRPLPFPAPDRLIRILEVSANGGRWWPSFPNAADWREHGRVFEAVGIGDVPRVVPVLLQGTAVRVPVSRASRGLFETLGVQPATGRLFTAGENRPGAIPVAIVSDRFWRNELRSQPIGEISLTIGLERYTVVGVLPPDFRFLGDAAAWTLPADVWTPLERDTNLGGRSSHGYHVVGRLRDGISLEQARAEMNQLAQTLKAQHRQPTQADSVLITPLQDVVVRNAREPLRLLLYAAGAVLLVSCLNLAAAILAQGLNRGRELSLRRALGATRGVLARHLLVDAAALAIPGALLGVTLAALGLRTIRMAAPGTLPRLDEATFDAQAFAVLFGLSAITACLAGVIPAVVLSRKTAAVSLRTHGATTGPPEQRRVWTAFVVAQVTLTVLLLSGTGLLIRSFMQALAVDLGYEPRNVLAVDVALPELRYAAPARRIAFYAAALERLRSSPGVAAAGLTSALPHDWSVYTSGTHQTRPDPKVVLAGFRLVDPDYFDTVGIPTLQGTTQSLVTGGAVIDQRLVNVLWNGGTPVGDPVVNGFAKEPLLVQAVVGTVREWNQGADTTGAVYQHYRQRPDRLQAMHVVVRHEGDATLALSAVRTAIAAVDPMVPVSIEPLATRAIESLRGRRLMLLLTCGFGIAALLLAAGGVYSIVAFVVGRQLREAAIRLALGAMPSSLRRRVLLQGLMPAAFGVAMGLVLALPMGHAMRAQLFNVNAADPAVLSAAMCVVVLAAVLASLLPARRAARVDPARALRDD